MTPDLFLRDIESAGYRICLIADIAKLVAKSGEPKHINSTFAGFEKIEASAHRPAGPDEFKIER